MTKTPYTRTLREFFLFYTQIFFLLLILFFSLFSYISEKNSIEEYKKIISDEIGGQIHTQLKMFFQEAPRVLQINNEFAKIGSLDLANHIQIQQIFTSQIKNYPYLTYISYGNTKGEYIGVNRSAVDEKIYCINALAKEKMHLNTYALTPNNTKGELIKEGKKYNATIRPWYTHAIENGGNSWYNPYKHANNESMGIGISTPITDKKGKVVGVFSADQSLVKISEFLKTLNLQKHGLAFIAQKDGSMIATSLQNPVYTTKDSQVIRYSLANYPDKRLVAIYPIVQTFDKSQKNKTVTIEGKEYLYHQFLFEDEYGLSIVVGILLAEEDFSSGFEKYIFIWGLAIWIFIIFAIFVFNSLSKRLVTPIEKLNLYTKDIAQGDFEIVIENQTNISEINELSNSFDTMKTKLKESFYLLIAQASFTNIGKTLSSIYHQYKTPLSHINSQVLSLEAYLFKTNNQDVFLQDIAYKMRKDITFMDTTMGNFNNFYKNSLQKEPIHIKEEILFIKEMLRDKIIELDLQIKIMCEEIVYEGYKNGFDNVLMILIENAIDIFQSRKTPNPKLSITVENKENTLLITLLDNGGGITINPTDAIFNTFVSSKKRSSGLGLAMCKMLVEKKLEGTITASNKKDGACFEIVLAQ
jgi:signal transduction histidine kinase